ncbi:MULTISPECIES: hypothetical protein [Spirulina sp. CCY15215]|uniref:hypothetical protein n=1 Tax=Spirulina sp. CCY15215 TaxID=2767591 RepID=UPI0019514A69|nr:hypothetical protein [Spirulina major]
MIVSKTRNTIAKYSVDILYCLFLLAIAFKFTQSLETIKDIELYDETFYLYQGIKIFELGIPKASWAPLYSMWYYFLSLFEQNNIALFYLNFKLLIFTSPSIFYIYLRTLKIRPLISIIFGFIYSISTISLLTPRLGSFLVLILLPFLIVANFTKDNTKFYFLATLALLLIIFVRPEYTISFLILFSLYMILLIRSILLEKNNLKNAILQSSFLISLILLFFLVIGNPLAGRRSFMAFSQHFGFLWMERNNVVSPYLDYYKVVTQSIFGDATNIFQVIIANPREFLIHVRINFISYIHHSISILLVNLQNDFSTVVNTTIRRFETILLLIVIIIPFWRSRILLKQINYLVLKRLLIIFLSLFIPVFLSSLLINPRFHYLILQSIFLLTIIAYFLENSFAPYWKNLRQKNRIYKLLSPILIGSFLLILTPNLARGWCLTENFCIIQRISSPQTLILPNLKTIEFIQSLQIEDDVNILEADGGYNVYLGDRYHHVHEYQKQTNFKQFLDQEKINMVVLTAALDNDVNFSQDEEFVEFVHRPEQWNFTKLKIPETEGFLLLASDLIEN